MQRTIFHHFVKLIVAGSKNSTIPLLTVEVIYIFFFFFLLLVWKFWSNGCQRRRHRSLAYVTIYPSIVTHLVLADHMVKSTQLLCTLHCSIHSLIPQHTHFPSVHFPGRPSPLGFYILYASVSITYPLNAQSILFYSFHPAF